MRAYLTIEEAKAFGVELEDSSLLALIGLYSGLVEEYCRTRFLPEKAEFRADVQKRITLPHLPLISVEDIRYLGSPLVADEDYFGYPELGMVRFLDSEKYPKKRRSITIDYTYGYEETPMAVKKVIVDLIRLDTGSMGPDASGNRRDPTILSENFDGEYSYTRNGAKTAEDMRRDILTLLDPFVQPVYEAKLQETGNVRARLV